MKNSRSKKAVLPLTARPNTSLALTDKQKTVAWTDPGRGRAFDRAGQSFVPSLAQAATHDTVAMLRRHLLREGRTLDLGCGTGRIALPLARTTQIQVVGFDASRSMLTQMSGENGPNVWRVNASSQAGVPFGDNVFDSAYCIGVLPHYVDWRPVLAPIIPTLKGGCQNRIQPSLSASRKRSSPVGGARNWRFCDRTA